MVQSGALMLDGLIEWKNIPRSLLRGFLGRSDTARRNPALRAVQAA